ncbi:Unknown protein [Striga hermonthica]|uniref:Uncharacterized protein n=1 Tax=Striga hermonthica TaxID=68872 RepID=A0A9N7R7S2_STRHE|nr:Unknown protein [Striga hermonthica]
MLNQASKDSSNAASARIGVREHLNQSNAPSNVPSAGVEGTAGVEVTGASGTSEVHHGSSGEGDNTTVNHTNESGIPQTLEASNQNHNLNAAEDSGNLQDTSIKGKASVPKRKRGQTMGKGLMKAFDATGKKLKVDVDPLTGRPKSREQSAKLSSQIGVVARDVLRVPRKWKEMAEEKFLEPDIDHIKIHMDVNLDAPGVRHCLVDRMKSSSRQIRYRLHKHYKKYATLQEAKNNKPPFCASKENWDELCDYFASAKFKHQSSINSMNRQMLRTPHISGRTPFSTLQHEIAQKKNATGDANGDVNGDVGDIIEFYILTHYTNKHGWSNNEAKENWISKSLRHSWLPKEVLEVIVLFC